MTAPSEDEPITRALGPAPDVDPVARHELLLQVEHGLFGHAAPPPRVGRYELLHRLGAGGQGVVYVAFNPELDRHVAIKLLLSGRAADEQRQRSRLHEATTLGSSGAPRSRVPDRLWREAQAMARLSHPNVVTVHDVGVQDEVAFVVMELIDGETLRDWVGERSRRPAEVLEILIQAGRGLAAAHAVATSCTATSSPTT